MTTTDRFDGPWKVDLDARIASNGRVVVRYRKQKDEIDIDFPLDLTPEDRMLIGREICEAINEEQTRYRGG